MPLSLHVRGGSVTPRQLRSAALRDDPCSVPGSPSLSLGDITSVALEEPQLSSRPHYEAHSFALNDGPSQQAQWCHASEAEAWTLPGVPVSLALSGVELRLLDPQIGISSRIICVYPLRK